MLEQLPRLALLVTTGMRNASVDVAYLHEHRGFRVSGTAMGAPDAGVPTTVEVAWALMLSVLKRVTLEDRAIRSRHLAGRDAARTLPG